MSKEIANTTRELRSRMDDFISRFEEEFKAQATKVNSTSEKRMRKLLRETQALYKWYRDASIAEAKERDRLRQQRHPF